MTKMVAHRMVEVDLAYEECLVRSLNENNTVEIGAGAVTKLISCGHAAIEPLRQLLLFLLKIARERCLTGALEGSRRNRKQDAISDFRFFPLGLQLQAFITHNPKHQIPGVA